MIVHAVASVDPATGGPAHSVPSLAAALKAGGIPAMLLVSRRPGAAAAGCLTSHRLQAEYGASPKLSGCELIHDHGVWLPFNHFIAGVAKTRSVPRIVSPRGMLEPWAINHRKWKKRLAWWLYQRSDLRSAVVLHATAASEAKQFRALGLRQPIAILPNGVEVPPVPLPESTTQSPGTRTAVFLGRIHPIKGLPLLVKAWAAARPVGWRMRVVGPDERGHRGELQRLVAQCGLAGSWTFEDAVDDAAKWRILADADLCILPSFSESFGIFVAEALAAGTPVIATTGTPWQGLETQRCGWWVRPEVQSLAAALQTAAATNPKELSAMGARGRQWVTQEFAWPAIAQQMADVYRWVLGGQEKPDCVQLK